MVYIFTAGGMVLVVYIFTAGGMVLYACGHGLPPIDVDI